MDTLLADNSDWFRSVVATMAVGMVLLDKNAAILACNASAERLLGLSQAQLAGRTPMDPRWQAIREDGSPFPGDQHPSMVTLRTGVPQRGVIAGVRRPDDTLVWLSTNSQLFELSQGTSKPGVLCTFADITALRHTQEALRESKEHYRVIVNTSLEGIWTIDVTGKTTFANARMAELLGTSLEDLEQSSLWDFVDPEDRAMARNNMTRRSEGVREEHDFRFRRRDGSHVWTSLATSPVYLQGKPGALAMVRDITNARRAQQDLRTTNERLGRALEAARMYAWEIEPETSRILWARNYQQVLGLPPKRTFEFGNELIDIVRPEDRESVAQTVSALSSGQASSAVSDFRICHPDGKTHWIQTRAERQTDPITHVTTLLGTSFDVTERKELENELLQARKLEALGRLAGGVAHDFNNLLTVMLAALDFAEQGKGELQEELTTMRTAAERAAALTGQLLAFARKQALDLRTVELDALIGNLESVCRRLLGEHAELSIVSTPGLWPVRADPHLLEQILFNLIANARDALVGRGGKVRIATRNVSLARPLPGLPEGDYVLLSVHDDGPGIAADAREHVFEPFFTTKAAGTGLGLASCYGSVKQLGGRIDVTSDPGAGCTFEIHLPRSRTIRSERPPAPRREAVACYGTVLLVEDEDLIRMYAARGLSERGYDVLQVGSAEEAQSLVARHPGTIDALVTDVVLPRMSGPAELAARMREDRPELPVLFVSGYPHDVLERNHSLGSCAKLLSKPYRLEQLASELGELLASARL